MHVIKVFIVLLLSCVPVLAGEGFITLKSGGTDIVSYGLSCLVSDSRAASNAPVGADLVLTLRNNGAKWIGLNGVTTNNFSLQDAKEREMKFYLISPPQSIAYGEATMIHLRVANAGNAPLPWTLHFNSPPSGFVYFELTITNITFPRN